MAYTKQNFKSGDMLYASQLNIMDEQIFKNESDIGNLDDIVHASADDLYTSGVLMTDDMESFVMTGKTSDTGTPQVITSPGVVYIKGLRRQFAKSTRTFNVPEKERVSAQYIRLNEITGEIERQYWEDVIIDGDIHNGGTITEIDTGYTLPLRSGGYYDVILCIVPLPAGATEVTPDMITDLRGDNRYCGYVKPKIGGSGNGISTNAVNLLIEILRNSIYTKDMSDNITSLKNALYAGDSGNTGGNTGAGDDTDYDDDTNVDTGDSYEKLVVNASISAVSNTQGVELGNYNNGQRATLLASDGIVKLPITGSGDMTSYSLIRIPRDTSKVTINGSAEFTFGVFIFELLNGTTFSKKVDSGWIDMAESKYVYDILTNYADGNHYIAVNFRMDNASVFDVNSYKNALSLDFGDTSDSGNTDDGTGGDNGDNNTNEETVEISAVLVSASVTGSSATGAELGNYNNNQRATLLTTDGSIKLTVPATGETTNYSLIKIPKNAVRIMVNVSADFHYGISFFSVSSDNSKYQQCADLGWIDITGYAGVHNIDSKYADGNHYIAINFKLDSGNTFNISDYRDAISAKFMYQ